MQSSRVPFVEVRAVFCSIGRPPPASSLPRGDWLEGVEIQGSRTGKIPAVRVYSSVVLVLALVAAISPRPTPLRVSGLLLFFDMSQVLLAMRITRSCSLARAYYLSLFKHIWRPQHRLAATPIALRLAWATLVSIRHVLLHVLVIQYTQPVANITRTH